MTRGSNQERKEKKRKEKKEERINARAGSNVLLRHVAEVTVLYIKNNGSLQNQPTSSVLAGKCLL